MKYNCIILLGVVSLSAWGSDVDRCVDNAFRPRPPKITTALNAYNDFSDSNVTSSLYSQETSEKDIDVYISDSEDNYFDQGITFSRYNRKISKKTLEAMKDSACEKEERRGWFGKKKHSPKKNKKAILNRPPYQGAKRLSKKERKRLEREAEIAESLVVFKGDSESSSKSSKETENEGAAIVWTEVEDNILKQTETDLTDKIKHGQSKNYKLTPRGQIAVLNQMLVEGEGIIEEAMNVLNMHKDKTAFYENELNKTQHRVIPQYKINDQFVDSNETPKREAIRQLNEESQAVMERVIEFLQSRNHFDFLPDSLFKDTERAIDFTSWSSEEEDSPAEKGGYLTQKRERGHSKTYKLTPKETIANLYKMRTEENAIIFDAMRIIEKHKEKEKSLAKEIDEKKKNMLDDLIGQVRILKETIAEVLRETAAKETHKKALKKLSKDFRDLSKTIDTSLYADKGVRN